MSRRTRGQARGGAPGSAPHTNRKGVGNVPLTALCRPIENPMIEWVLVDVTDYAIPRVDLAGNEFQCPECHATMHIRGGLLKIVHFAHNPRQSLDCALRAGETVRHLLGKAQIARDIAELSAYAGATIRKEVWLPEVNRRADVAVLFADGPFDVHEIQLAKTTPEELFARTNDYRTAGAVEVVWWFGGAADTSANREWAYENCGGYGTISFKDAELVHLCA